MAKHVMWKNTKKFQLSHTYFGSIDNVTRTRRALQIFGNNFDFLAPFLKSKFMTTLFFKKIDFDQPLPPRARATCTAL